MTLRPLLFASLFAATTALAQEVAPATPPPTPAAPEQMVDVIKLPDTSLDAILQLLEQWTGRTILRPAALPTATYNLVTDKPMPKSEAIRAIETLLAHNQIGVTPLGERFLTVVPLPNLRTNAPRMLDGSALDLPPSGTIMAKLFQLEFLRATELVQQLGQFLNPQLGGPVVFDKNNTILITDSVATLQRIEQLLLKLDKPITENLAPKFYTLRGGAKASAVVNQLRTMLQGVPQTQLGTATTYSSDDRTNQVILIADPRQHAFFDDLIAKLDVQADPNIRNEVIPLKHATAKDVASVITQLVSGQNKATTSGGSQSVRQGQMAPVPAPPGAVPGGPIQVQQPTPNLLVETKAEFSSLLTILSDDRSNAVVVSGTADDIRIIRDLVEQLDVLLAQVRIEVVIAEVTLGNNDSTGISALGLQVEGDKLIGFSAALEGASIGGSAANSFATITRPGAAGFISGNYDLAAIIGLSTTPRKDNADLLSVPAISTTHNKEARIFVGEQRPVISSYLNDGLGTGGGTGSTIGSGYRSTVTSKDIGIELKVKPLIGNDGSVQLDIKLEVNDILGDIVIDGNPQPNIGRRATESFVSVKSNEIVVLGGLQRTTTRNATSRLGPIPIIGDLLGKRTRSRNRTDLVFFLRPIVLTGTSVDNAEAMNRVNSGPQKDSVNRALDPTVAVTPAKNEEYGSTSRSLK